ncbi:MAG: secondary thiamine-phosphate synthase enzyme YjbQ [Pseudomonadaceae bacterium]|nr:secondary thiamine-phosphate synthase enzyme YjbQ [Pseudomonadaceae bacterium]
MIKQLTLPAQGRGLHDITHKVSELVTSSGEREGLVTLFLQHTSASLLIQENADPAVLHDLEAWMNRAVPDGDPSYTHTAEGIDDMPAHIKGALTTVSLAIPVLDGRLALGTWQGIYLWEHRNAPHTRKLLVHINH